ncbi:MAG TPA: Sjogren's syndrome/scleroderma autoantigen 1 family protein [Candidatus Acidoferrales bacterium]|nr:Sjogren's syndrome/scleroderma autoantigen 1 family protein [Candidatus Acidoferrales bacterium]
MPLDDRELEQISKMLERGGKMLADHCVACKSPLFKFEGKTTCPVCTYRQMQNAIETSESPAEVSTQAVQSTQSVRTSQRVSLDDVITELISNLATEMRTETDLTRIHTQLECIERGLRIIQLIRGIDSLASDARRG